VLAAINRWSEAKSFRRRQTATICFLLLALDVREEDPDSRFWPALLALAERDSVARDHVVALWGQALDAAYFRSDAEAAFADWIELAGGSEDVLGALSRLTLRLAEAGTYARDRLLVAVHSVRNRRRRNPSAADAAEVLLEQLGYEETSR